MTTIQVCRTCLAHDTSMYTIAHTPLHPFYEKITNVTLDTQNGRPALVCYTCYHLLKKCHSFAENAVRADEVLQEIYKSGMQITKENIASFKQRHLVTSSKTLVTQDATREVSKDIDIPNVKNESLKIKMENEEIAERSGNYLLEYATEYEIKKEEIEVDESQYHLHHSLDSDDDVPLQSIRMNKEHKAVGRKSVVKKTGKETIAMDATKCSGDNLPEYAMEYEIKKEEIEVEDTEYHPHHYSDFDDDVALQRIRIKKENEGVGQEVVEMGGQGTKDGLGANTRIPSGRLEAQTSNANTAAENSLKNITIVQKGINKLKAKCNLGNKQPRVKKKILSGYVYISYNKVPVILNLPSNPNLNPNEPFTGQKGKRITTICKQEFICDYCGNKFTAKTSLISHIKIHTGEKPFTCNYCERKFTVKCNMIRHVKIHTGENPFTCNYCGKKFKAKSYLTEHVRTHTGEMPFPCNYCGKKFSVRSRLNRHVRIHTGENQVTCNNCDKKFTRKYDLTRHVKGRCTV